MALRYALLFCTPFLYFQSPAQNRIALFVSPQATSATYTIKNTKQSTEHKFGFQTGAGLKIPFEKWLYFTPSLFYSMKGYRVTLNKPSFPPSSVAIDNNTRLHTVEIAPLLQVDFSNVPSHLFLQAGPAMDIVLSGNETFHTATGETITQKMTFSFSHYGRITASAIVRIGYEMVSGLFLFGHYAHGLGSLNNADGGPVINHRIFGIGAGKYFSKRNRL